jgi:hypothetical protein
VITKDTQVIGVPGDDLNRDQVQAILENSPALVYASLIFSLAKKYRVRVSFILAQFLVESGLGTAGVAVKAFNPGNVRSSVSGLGEIVDDWEKGPFVYFNNWGDGFREMFQHTTAPNSVYAKEGRTTIRQVIERWAPPSDKNDTGRYISNVVGYMSKWLGEGSMFDLNNIPFKQSPNYDQGGNSMKKIVIHSTEGSYTSSVGWLLSSAAQASAHYIINEDGSQCTQLVKDESIAWHTGNYAYNRMCIGIEHSWFSDGRNGPPPDSLYQAGAKLTAMLCKKHGIIPNRGNILAHGEVPPPNDHRDPGPNWNWGKFMAYVVQAFNGSGGSTPVADSGMIMLNNFMVGHGFLDYFNKYGGVKVFGLPLSNEQTNPRTGLVEQVFERICLEYQPDADPEWQVRGKDIGRFYLANRGF